MHDSSTEMTVSRELLRSVVTSAHTTQASDCLSKSTFKR